MKLKLNVLNIQIPAQSGWTNIDPKYWKFIISLPILQIFAELKLQNSEFDGFTCLQNMKYQLQISLKNNAKIMKNISDIKEYLLFVYFVGGVCDA